ncbi:MAG: nucleotide-binding domain containing protein, partial [Povalibacter sp.]
YRHIVDLIVVLSRAELSAAVVPLEVVRDSESLAQTLERLRSEGHDVAICDATEQSDLQCIARAGVEFEDAVLIGSAGLASAIAALLPNGSAIGTRIQKTRPVLTVIGSQASESHRSARRLIQDTGLHSVSVDVQLLEDPQARRTLEALVDDAAWELRAQHDVLIYLTETKELPLSIRAEVAQNLAAMLTPLFPLAGSLVASGGDTAAALLVRAGVQSIRLLDEMDPGVCLGLTMGDLCIPIVTKSGSFGSDESLVRIVRHLHALESGGPR